MKVYGGKNIKYQDKLAEKRRRVWILKILFFIGLSAAIVAFILYLLFFSGWLEIKGVSISGLDKISNDDFNRKINERLNSKWLGLVGYQRNVLVFDRDAFRAEALAAFPEIKEIFVNKEPPHTLNIDVVERTTAGVWCFASGCKYFDEEGAIWGEAARSSGFLILVIEDMRQNIRTLDRELLGSIMLISRRLKEDDIFINKFVMPNNFIGDFSAFTSAGYELLFSMDSNIENHIKSLEIFLAEKKNDFDFDPQYIDLRINGRIYFK